MLSIIRYALVLGVGFVVASPVAPKLPQKAPNLGPASYQPNQDRLDAVAAAFKRSWQGYMDDAFPADSLAPIKGAGYNDRNGWGASAIDALSTAVIMDDADTVNSILQFVPSIDFSKTNDEVSLFETTIRYLGGLLAGYDLLKGPKQGMANDKAIDPLLAQARKLADNLKFAFDTPTGIPDNSLYLSPKPRVKGSQSNSLATMGTLVMEWTRLSDLTGDPTYGNLTQRAEGYLLTPEPPDSEPFPGLVGNIISIKDGKFTNAVGGWNGGTDSFYEYLIKMYLYDPGRFSLYRDRWIKAAESSIEFLASHPTTRPDLTFMAEYNGKSLLFSSSHLACFHGGNFILGGMVLQERKFVDFGLELTHGCHETYAKTETGIGPDGFNWQDNKVEAGYPKNDGPPKAQSDFYDTAGFWITSASYVLRPEVIESYYYAYRATGDPKYQEWAWQAFVHINQTCTAGSGFAGITDVNAPHGGKFYDSQESFWFAEVMKYSYLIHAPESDFQVKTDGNKFVFNTEAHPFQIPTSTPTRSKNRNH